MTLEDRTDSGIRYDTWDVPKIYLTETGGLQENLDVDEIEKEIKTVLVTNECRRGVAKAVANRQQAPNEPIVKISSLNFIRDQRPFIWVRYRILPG